MPRKSAWKRDAVTNTVGEDGLRTVNLPSLKAVGITDAERDAIFAYERPVLGTMRATIRMNQRAQGHLTHERDGDGNKTGGFTAMRLMPKRLAEAGAIPSGLERFYDPAIHANGGKVTS